MSVSAVISHQLPMLRRFARALTGSQNSGDAYVVATLEAIIESGGTLDDNDPRRALFAAFLRIWQSVPVNSRDFSEPRSEHASRGADRSLERMDDTEIADLLDEAGKEISAMIATDVLIIEDEPIIAMDLEALVTELGHNVTHIARTQKEAVAAIAEQTPGLVLADIHLADGSSGLDAVNDILEACTVPVIFITSHSEAGFEVSALEMGAADYIGKPFKSSMKMSPKMYVMGKRIMAPEVVKAIISQALFFDRRAGVRPESAAA